jgi:hypothetical protein
MSPIQGGGSPDIVEAILDGRPPSSALLPLFSLTPLRPGALAEQADSTGLAEQRLQ